MRALSVKQPFAEMIANGKKKKEYRSWSRTCFGDLLIVASKTKSEDFADYADQVDAKRLVFSKAVCVVDFYKVTGDDGDYAWHVRNPRRVVAFDVTGYASLYHVDDALIRYVDGSARVSAASPRDSQQQKPKPARSPRRGKRCAKCGAYDVVRIVWGEPTPAHGEAAKRGEIVLGGCCVTDDDPVMRCRSCRTDVFAIPEMLRGR